MSYSGEERAVLDRFVEKTRIAGGPKPGYMMRRDSIVYGLDDPHRLNGALESLVERGVLKLNEGGDRYYLTAEGAEQLAQL